ncbi:hypothetical protein [Falsiroseomonas selenitidurans]|uniref:Uncharacterized protein n=1 Tax=Falsiroseomonas selenitidurans TaxID=2716335 RepID=A0ABX1E846_9PROT|nr:hypothetical protein [Falsiroseomonas selenitidurans]NKC32940.1 hypothetical protein [Falsiroseomonas selenitidurans]
MSRMPVAPTVPDGQQSAADAQATDRNALVLILEYVEAECRRLGAEGAARHAALAAALMPQDRAPAGIRLN